MPKSHSLFTRIVVILLLFLTVVMFLYAVSNRVYERVIKSQITEMAINHLQFFTSQLDRTVLQLETSTTVLLQDPTVDEFQDLSFLNNPYERMKKKATILEKINLQSYSSAWSNDITLFAPQTGDLLSTVFSKQIRLDELEHLLIKNWNFRQSAEGSPAKAEFIHINVEPYNKNNDLGKASTIIEVSFPARNLIQMMDQFKADGKGDPLFYMPNNQTLLNSTFDKNNLTEIGEVLQRTALDEKGHLTMDIGNVPFLVTYTRVDSLEGYIVNAEPLRDFLLPIRNISITIYLCIGVLLLISIIVAWLLYRTIQLPIVALIKGVQQLKLGRYGERISLKVSNEFQFIIYRFNEMSEQIKQLIENVYEVKIQSQEAELKQLQSQINPHFLYNCLSYIVGMTKLGRKDAVLQMTYHLSDYYRYSTQVDVQEVKLSDELKTSEDYLSIQRMRMNRIHYSIHVEPEMLPLIVPRLILQPLVENAVVHALERLEDDGQIIVTGYRTQSENVLIVEDNGKHLTDNRIAEILQSLEAPRDKGGGSSYGLRNVHRRLVLRYGEGSGLTLSRSAMGGLRAVLHWNREEEPKHDEVTDSG